MRKLDLIRQVQRMTGATLKDSTATVDAVFESIAESLASGEEIMITGFGKFWVGKIKERTGINPQDRSKKITIPATVVPKFSAGKTLKDRVKSSVKK